METNQTARHAEQTSRSHDKLYMENTLLRVSGAHVLPRCKTGRPHAGDRTQSGIERSISSFVPIRDSGSPVHSLTRFLSRSSKNIPTTADPSRRKSRSPARDWRLIGRKEWGGRDSEQLSRALHEIHYTSSRRISKSGDARFVEHSFNVFPRDLIDAANSPPTRSRRARSRSPSRSLHPCDEHFTCLNHFLMMRLGTIGQALYMRLFFHFANLYEEPTKQTARRSRSAMTTSATSGWAV